MRLQPRQPCAKPARPHLCHFVQRAAALRPPLPPLLPALHILLLLQLLCCCL